MLTIPLKRNIVLIDYFCWAVFSMTGGLYFVLPLFLHNVIGFTEVKASTAVSVFLVSSAIGVISYSRLVTTLQRLNFLTRNQISADRIFLGISGIIVSFILFELGYIHSELEVFVCMSVLGVVSSAFFPLCISILNTHTHTKNTIKHASLQSWSQNIGMGMLFGLFAYTNTENSNLMFFILSSLIGLAALIELACSKGNAFINSGMPEKTVRKHVLKQNQSTATFFILFTISMIIFMQIPTIYSFYLNKLYGIDYKTFSSLMILNVLIVITCQIPITNLIIDKIKIKANISIGIFLIALGLILPLFNDISCVIVSFVLWTLGEIFFFTATRAILMKLSSNDKKLNAKLSLKYYTIFDLSSLSSPAILMLAGSNLNYSLFLGIIFILAIFTSLVCYTKLDY